MVKRTPAAKSPPVKSSVPSDRVTPYVPPASAVAAVAATPSATPARRRVPVPVPSSPATPSPAVPAVKVTPSTPVKVAAVKVTPSTPVVPPLPHGLAIGDKVSAVLDDRTLPGWTFPGFPSDPQVPGDGWASVVKGTIVARDASTGWVMVAIQSDRFPEGLMSTHDPDVLSTDLYPIGVKGAVKSARSLSVKLCAESCERAAKAATILGLSTTEREDLLRSGWEKLSTTERVTLQKTYGQKGGVPVSLDSLVALWAKRDQSSEAVAARAKAREAAKAARDAFRRAYPSGVDAFIPEREAARVATQAREDERAVKAARVAATASAASPVVQSPTATPGAVKVTTATPGATTTTPGAVKVPRKSKAALAGR